jgi:hypothetical protein
MLNYYFLQKKIRISFFLEQPQFGNFPPGYTYNKNIFYTYTLNLITCIF